MYTNLNTDERTVNGVSGRRSVLGGVVTIG